MEDVVERASRLPAIPISWGTIAQYVGKGKLANNESHTHKWMVFLRGANNQDISYAVSKVTFELHRDFENYRRGALPRAYCSRRPCPARALPSTRPPPPPRPRPLRRGHGAALPGLRNRLGRLHHQHRHPDARPRAAHDPLVAVAEAL